MRVIDEKRAISESTVKNLRSLTQHTRVPRDNHIRRLIRRPSASHLNAELMTDGPDVMFMDDDSDEVDTIVDSGVGSSEGVHLGSELYDAYTRTAPWPVLPHPPRSFPPSYPGDDDVPSAPLSPSSPSSTSRPPWSMPPLPILQPYSLTRQPSVRRSMSTYRPPSRYRDFSEHTHARRTSLRQSSSTPDPRDDTERSDSFHPVSVRPRRTWTSWFSDPARSPWATSASTSDPDPNPHMPWASSDHLPLPTPSSTSSSQGDEDESFSAVRPRIRRLRRGGLRAPESMTFRDTSTPLAPLAGPASTLFGPGPAAMPPSPISTPVSPPDTAARTLENETARIHENEPEADESFPAQSSSDVAG